MEIDNLECFIAISLIFQTLLSFWSRDFYWCYIEEKIYYWNNKRERSLWIPCNDFWNLLRNYLLYMCTHISFFCNKQINWSKCWCTHVIHRGHYWLLLMIEKDRMQRTYTYFVLVQKYHDFISLLLILMFCPWLLCLHSHNWSQLKNSKENLISWMTNLCSWHNTSEYIHLYTQRYDDDLLMYFWITFFSTADRQCLSNSHNGYKCDWRILLKNPLCNNRLTAFNLKIKKILLKNI